MSGSISSTTATGSTTAAQSAASQTPQNALASLTDNYQTFLTMLTTQLQNQDPTSPMDSSQFTTELVQFAGVEQQIATNTNLTQLIQLTQGAAVEQSGQIVGKHVQATSSQLSLQQGTAQVDFTAPAAGSVALSVTNAAGTPLYSTTVSATQGANVWTWNGQTASGVTAPDGAYNVSVNAIAADGSTSTLPFTIVGTATSVQESKGTVTVNLGALPVNMTNVTSVQN